MPEISVIVPVFDMERYLRQCVESVLAQTFHDWELLLVDDGSSDSSGALCDGFAAKDSRIRAFHIANSGPGAARNFGIEKASAPWIAFLDADDLLHPRALELLRAAALRSGLPLVAGSIKPAVESFLIASGSGKDLSAGVMNASRNGSVEELKFRVSPADSAVGSLLYQRGLDTSAYGKLFSRSLFEGLGFTPGILYEDLDLLYRLILKAGEIAEIPQAVYYHRKNPRSLLSRFTPARRDALTVTRHIESYMARCRPELLGAARARRLAANFNIFCLAGFCEDAGEEIKNLPDLCWREIKRLRGGCFLDPRLRMKDRLGIIVSYFGGRKLVKMLSRFVY